MKKTIIGIIMTALLGGGAIGGYKLIRDKTADTFENSVHTVVNVVDGDTIDIERDTRIRLLGLDAPERGDCYFEESKQYLTDILEGTDIYIEKDITGSDTYDRLLRYVYIPADDPEDDDMFINEMLIRNGYAQTHSKAPDNRYRDLFASAQEDAKKHNRGLWKSCDYAKEEEKETASKREADTAPPSSECTIKGNISEKGYGKNYFLDYCPNYTRIKIDPRKGEQYFCSEEKAQEADFVRSKSCDSRFAQ